MSRFWYDDVARALRATGRFVVALAIFSAIFYFLADFSIRQSVALALLTAWLIYGFGQTKQEPHLRFVPHFVHVWPSWFEILTDLELISAPHEYDKLYKTFKAAPPEQYNVFRDGVRFTILDDFPGERTLVYSDDYDTFVSKVDFERSLEPLTLSRKGWYAPGPIGSAEPWHFTPKLFVEGAHGALQGGKYDIGVIVPDRWWEGKEPALSGIVKAEKLFDTGTVRLTIATIPRSEFTLYWERVGEPYRKGDEILRKHRVEDRAKFGWTVEDKGDDYAVRNWPEILKHKYFSVHHRRI